MACRISCITFYKREIKKFFPGRIPKGIFFICCTLSLCQLHAQPYISTDTPPSCYEIEGRVRNGLSAYEGALYTPSTPGPQTPGGAQWKMDPAGKPVWNSNGNHYGDIHTFRLMYTQATATTVWSIDFNRDGDYGDARETITNVAPTHVGKGFQYINVFGQGYDGATVSTLKHFTINGEDFGTFTSSTNTPFSVLFEDSTGLFRDIIISGEFSFTAGYLSERPRIWIQLGESNLGPPTCVLTKPLDGTFYSPGTIIPIAATAVDYLGKVVKVEFYDGDIKIGEDITSPFTFDYANAPSGLRKIRAKAIDNHQAMTYSNIAYVVVNALPTALIIAPSEGAWFYDPDILRVEAVVFDINDTTNNVEFYLDDILIGTDAVAPYSMSILNIPIGTHSVKVKSFDPYGAIATSPSVSFVASCIREDVNNDGTVSTFDFLEVLSSFGSDCGICPTEFNDDGRVDTFDYLRILARYGYSCN